MKFRLSLPRLLFLGLLVVVATLLVINVFSTGEKKIKHNFPHEHGVDHPQFLRSMGVLLGPPLVDGNRVDTLLNGDQIFPAMLEAIRAAKKTITFETYIYWSGEIGKEFADALAERARAGVKVHVLLDWVGSQKMDAKLLDEMREAGVEIEKYHPPKWYTLDKLNNRTHRKLLVVDGQGRLHRRRRHRRPMERPRAGPRPLARHALPRRGAGGRADAGRIRRQLDQGERRRAAGRGILSGVAARGRPLRADLQELAGGRRGEHPPHVPAVDRRRAQDDRPRPWRTSSPTTSRSTRWSTR